MSKLFLVCGYVASGKTTVANFLAKEAELIVIRTDDIRKRLFPKEFPFESVDLNDSIESVEKIKSWIKNNPGVDLQQVLNPLYPFGDAYTEIISMYSSEMGKQKKEVYDKAFVELDEMLSVGRDVLFDATFSNAEMRQRAYRIAAKNDVEKIYAVCVFCDESIVVSRLAKRRSGEQATTSNARDVAVFRAVKKEFDESRIQDDVPGVNFFRIAYNTGTQTARFFGEKDKTTQMIKNVLSLLSRAYGGIDVAYCRSRRR